ncbi:MAG: ecdysteroid 22-kinase family protein [Deltaproteobacteria bacterium]|jgi:hypothetical protein|nr:ecdysteroid 22-kinase family protein [Deltaproteobacteria bacterium]
MSTLSNDGAALHWPTVVEEATGAEVARWEEVQSLWSGYGQIIRCWLQGSKPASVMVKHVRWPTEQDHPRGWNSGRSHRRKVRSYEVEATWYRDYVDRCGHDCRAPRLLALDRHGEDVVMVLEDLDDAGYPVRHRTVGERELRACLSWLAHFHATFMGQVPHGLWPVGTYWHLETRPDELEAIADRRLKESANSIDEMLAEAPFQTFVHGDAKLANFCFSADGAEVAAVDFQYVGGGCGMKDVAYLVGSCFEEDECEAREQELLDFYFARLAEALSNAGSAFAGAAVARAWRPLYRVAWVDFYRFLAGWSPGHWKIHRYSKKLANEVLAAL